MLGEDTLREDTLRHGVAYIARAALPFAVLSPAASALRPSPRRPSPAPTSGSGEHRRGRATRTRAGPRGRLTGRARPRAGAARSWCSGLSESFVWDHGLRDSAGCSSARPLQDLVTQPMRRHPSIRTIRVSPGRLNELKHLSRRRSDTDFSRFRDRDLSPHPAPAPAVQQPRRRHGAVTALFISPHARGKPIHSRRPVFPPLCPAGRGIAPSWGGASLGRVELLTGGLWRLTSGSLRDD
jgi:hypothetical protein